MFMIMRLIAVVVMLVPVIMCLITMVILVIMRCIAVVVPFMIDPVLMLRDMLMHLLMFVH